ncbi:hypothetical protein L1785_18980 [Antribacter sp. KLBMP9083]|uniref:Uncharacterized protein n=1 Tax=Antribacter soli TaxID=2910976 RepID=A0AA41QGJ4_9MICO|nr:hypothetical protein [Antribacter soli]MCF4123063.1 hypothetical protein [Antribacter soli]
MTDTRRIEAQPTVEVDIPVLTGLQRQGDVAIIPVGMAYRLDQSPPVPVPAEGIALISGETGHTHLLVADGPVTWTTVPWHYRDVGMFTVAAEAVAYVLHPEHAALGCGPGEYLVRRQEEMTPNGWRVVAD